MCFDDFRYVTLNRGPKTTLKKRATNTETNSFLEPPKSWFYCGKTMGYETTCFSQKNKTSFSDFFLDAAWCPETMFFTLCFEDFRTKKRCILGAHFGCILDPPEPKTMYFTMFFDDFTRFFFEPQKWPRRPRG